MSDRLAVAVAELVAALRDEIAAETRPAGAEPDRLLSIDQAAAALGVGRSAVYGELAAGRLHSLKVGRRRLIASADVHAYIEQAGARAGGR